MLAVLDPYRSLSFLSVVIRLALAMVLGGLLGLERVRKRRPAGFRTYMLVCIGAALTMILSQYELHMLQTTWAEIAAKIGIKPDVSRFSAQVINGIGFLGAGTVIVTGKLEVKGLTTAAGLWASACMGIAIGAGFYECVLLAFALIWLSTRVLPFIEQAVVENTRNINVYVEFESLDNVSRILNCIKSADAHIYEVDIDRGQKEQLIYPSATIYLRLNKRRAHARLILALSELECVHTIDEL